MAEGITEREEKLMFHTLGYDYQPSWNEKRKEARNWYGIAPSEIDNDYKSIIALVEKGWMQKDGNTPWGEEVFSVTQKGIDYVVDLWEKKKKIKQLEAKELIINMPMEVTK